MSRSPSVALVDYGAGNLRSVAKALERSGLRVEVTGDGGRVLETEALVLPGVGAFADAVATLRRTGLDAAVRESIARGRPYLGLCLGLQLLFDEGEEHGVTPGWGVLPGRVERFPERDPDGRPLRVPHIGWNEVCFGNPRAGAEGVHPMLAKLPERDFFYFVHSYRPVPGRPEQVVGRCDYGGEFAAAVATGNLFAVQFHPEKSQRAGHRLLDAFAGWVRDWS